MSTPKELHPEARLIVETISKTGFVAYYAGGWVRDFLLNRPSDDIDIATNAPPEVIQNLFPKTVPIGIAFGIILVLIGDKEFEVATFRNDMEYKDGRRPTKIEFTTAVEDAKRRDFTINGMFYDPLKDTILDFVGGKEDLEKKVIRAIGNAHERIREDRLRMIRAVRLSCRLKFEIDPATIQAIRVHAKELFPAVAIERIWQEFTKMASYPGFKEAILMLHDFHLLEVILPPLKGIKREELEKRIHAFDDFPKDMPVIAYILELFPSITPTEREEICKYFKLSNQEILFAQFLYHTEKLHEKKEVEKYEWAKFYANHFSTKSLQVLAARLPIHDRHIFLEDHEKRKKELLPSITRLQEKKPVVTSKHLQDHGINPGPHMGKLLMEAERIAINENLDVPEKVIKKLKI